MAESKDRKDKGQGETNPRASSDDAQKASAEKDVYLNEDDNDDLMEALGGRYPALWLGLLLIPFAVAVFFTLQPKEEEKLNLNVGSTRANVPQNAKLFFKEDTWEGSVEEKYELPVERPRDNMGALLRAGSPVYDFLEQRQPKCDPGGWIGQTLDNRKVQVRLKTLPLPYRILTPTSRYTMDFKPERLNIDVRKNGTIVRAWCG